LWRVLRALRAAPAHDEVGRDTVTG